MVVNQEILKYASTRLICNRKDLMAYISGVDSSVSEATVSSQLSRLVVSGRLERCGRGKYRIPEGRKRTFSCLHDEEIQTLSDDLKRQFPYASMCIWKAADISSLMHHVPSTDFILCDVEKEAAQYVYEYLASKELTRRHFLRPSVAEVDLYLSYGPSIIVRNLVSESPVTITDGVLRPEIEKILVDIAGDNEFSYLQGSEIFHVYENAFESYDINKSKLLRYASRRGRADKVESLANIQK